MPNSRATPPKAHTYPSEYPPGVHWSVTISWEVLDMLVPGAISDQARALLAGMIAAHLVKERNRCASIARRGGSPHIAKAIEEE